jgi:type I restriction enzyme S subunit
MPEARTPGGGVPGHRFKPYPAYKDSGVEWLGAIPGHWEVRRLKFVVATPLAYGANEAAELTNPELPRYIRITDIRDDGVLRDDTFRSIPEDVAAPYLLFEGDILFARSGATVGKTFRYNPTWGVAAHAGYLIRARVHLQRADSRFVLYFTQSGTYWGWLRSSFIQSTIQNVSAERYASLFLPLPSLGEQRAIVAFLDRETARIDALVVKKERLIELLQEQRTALITRAVTKGVDPNVPVKDSGVEWLGEIPAHWEVKRLWHLTPSDRRIMYGIVLPGPNVEDGVPIVKGGDVSAERLHLDQLNRTTYEIESGYVRSRLRGGDVVYAIRGSIGEVAIVPGELEGANLTQDAARIAYTPATHGTWLLHALKSAAVFAQLEAGALGATIRGVNIRDLKRASIPVPPRVEQEAIASFLETGTARIDTLVTKVRAAIDRLKELRTALISAAVTGKIDVREVAIS